MSEKDFINEVDEDVRTDNLLKLWRKYSKYFYAVVIVILMIVGGISLIKNYRLKQSHTLSDQYTAALELLLTRKYDEGLKALEAIEKAASSRTIIYAIMAKLQRASLLIQQQKEGEKPAEEAVKIYWEISSNKDFPVTYRDAATYLCAFHALGQTYDEIPKDELLNRLKKMSEKESPSRLMVLELLAYYYKIDGEIDKARSACEDVLKDTGNPETAIIERCRAFISTLPVKVPEIESNESKHTTETKEK